MPKASVQLPRLLEPAIGKIRRVEVEGDTLGQAVDDLLGQYPTLRVHLLDEEGHLRPHVLCFHNGELALVASTRQLSNGPVAEGDQIVFLQAVSGG